jgi:undecaprenol kinase
MKSGLKNLSFFKRLGFAWNGILITWKNESSFRFQVFACFMVLGFLVWTRPPAVWWAIISVLNAAVLAAELFNTAIENVLDVVHPQMHPLVGQAKDCAAAAVLVLSLSSLAVFTALIIQIYF